MSENTAREPSLSLSLSKVSFTLSFETLERSVFFESARRPFPCATKERGFGLSRASARRARARRLIVARTRDGSFAQALKIRGNVSTDAFMMVDSPGMIDSPRTMWRNANETQSNAASRSERGYDFPGAVRWFAERADVILLFFDPDKPGTTGETYH